jgi:alkaline phosphatase D
MGRRTLLDRWSPSPSPSRVTRRDVLGGLGGVVAVGCASGNGGSKTGGGDSGDGLDSADSGEELPDGDSGEWTDPDGTCSPDSPTAEGDTSGARPSPFPANPFLLGVASGDPLHDRVVLWTRLVVEPTDVAASPSEPADVVWQLFSDAEGTDLLQEGMVETTADMGHSVHVDVDGLESATEYWYRFRCGDHESPLGRTRTLPCADALVDRVRIGFATCQNWLSGFYASHRSLAEAEVDLVVFLGDYIYESGNTGAVRDHGAPECVDLEGYRNRHALYRSDPDLQAAHHSAPWMPIWDDHEVDNNSVGAATDDDAFAARRRAAYQAWYEHMPVRERPESDGSLRIYRSVDFGGLARIVLLDGRQYRDPQPCGDDIGAACEEVGDERTFLGDTQEAWLDDTLRESSASWVLVANPVVMLPIDLGGAFLNPDQWDGYPRARERFLQSVADHAAGRTVLFTGDIHAAGIGYVPEVPSEYESTPAIAEVVVPATSSRFTHDLADTASALLASQPHIGFWDWTVNGWAEAVVGPDGIDVQYWLVDDATNPASEVRGVRRWRIEPDNLLPVEV